jgi:predicted phospho-2-dehydro-3-deoxyheptonate aldolase
MNGKRLRLARLRDDRSGRSIFLPLDHAVTLGPIQGVEQPWTLFQPAAAAGIQGIIVHRGLLRRGVERTDGRLPRLLHLSGSTALGTAVARKVLVASVVEALALGADAVSTHVVLGGEGERVMLRDLGRVAAACDRWGLPLLAMMYVRRTGTDGRELAAAVRHAARVGAELGADLVKIQSPGTADDVCEVVQSCFVPVLLAGGDRAQTDREVLAMVHGAIAAGASGVCIGRNVFQHPAPGAFLRALGAIVHDDLPVDEALGLVDAPLAALDGRRR